MRSDSDCHAQPSILAAQLGACTSGHAGVSTLSQWTRIIKQSRSRGSVVTVDTTHKTESRSKGSALGELVTELVQHKIPGPTNQNCIVSGWPRSKPFSSEYGDSGYPAGILRIRNRVCFTLAEKQLLLLGVAFKPGSF